MKHRDADRKSKDARHDAEPRACPPAGGDSNAKIEGKEE
jgi:hypothetical protein